MSARRASGALEVRVLRYLWSQPSGATPAEVRAELAAHGVRLAHTTVVTVLTRLWDKGDVTRERDGRSYRYVSVRTEAESAATRMQGVLADTGNRRDALVNFVSQLSGDDERELRELLRRMDS